MVRLACSGNDIVFSALLNALIPRPKDDRGYVEVDYYGNLFTVQAAFAEIGWRATYKTAAARMANLTGNPVYRKPIPFKDDSSEPVYR